MAGKFSRWTCSERLSARLDALTVIGTTLDPTTVVLTWDFGDGARTQCPADLPNVEHPYASPGRYTVRAQVNADGMLTELSWPLILSVRRADFTALDAPRGVPSLPAIHGSVRLPSGPRAFALPVFSLATKDATSTPGEWGSASPITWTTDVLARSLHVLTWEWQRAYSTGFGRLPVPDQPSETACWLHLPSESVAFGSLDSIQAQTLFLEIIWSKFDVSSSWTPGILASAANDLVAPLVSAGTLGVLTGMNLVGNVTVASADNSLFAPDVQRAMEVADRSTPKTADAAAVELKNLQVQRAREFAGGPSHPTPPVDWTSAWQWQVAQAATAAVNAFYQNAGAPGRMIRGTVFVVANPATGAATLRLVDQDSNFWASATAIRTAAPSVAVRDEDVLHELGDRNGQFVAVRGDAAFTVPGSGWSGLPRATWDVRGVTRALDASARSGFQTSSGSDAPLIPDQDSLGTAVQATILADGAEVRCAFDAASDTLGVARAVRPGIELFEPRPGDGGGLEPHARMWLAGAGPVGPQTNRGSDRQTRKRRDAGGFGRSGVSGAPLDPVRPDLGEGIGLGVRVVGT